MDKSIWVDFDKLNGYNMTFNFITGGRGTGKTYGALKYTYERKQRVLFIRRTQTELDLMMSSSSDVDTNPYKRFAMDNNLDIKFKRLNKNLYAIQDHTENEEGELIGYAAGLSTFYKIRGMDFSDVDVIIYDEFIAELHVRRIHGEADAFFNMYETVNRNREFEGAPPVKCWLLANSNNIYTPLFVSLQLIGKIENMAKRGQQYSIIADRSILLVKYYNDAFAEKKAKTALYKLTEGTEYGEMALNNEFAYNDFSLIEYRNIKGMIPVCSVEDMYVYRTKDGNLFYVSYAKTKCKYTFKINPQEKMRFRSTFGTDLYILYEYSRLWFESYDIKQRFLDFLMIYGYKSS